MPVIAELASSTLEIVNNTVCRELMDPQSAEIPVDPTLGVLDTLVGGVIHGTDISEAKEEVQRILASQREKSDIVVAMLRNHNYWRVNEWIKVRAENEARIFKASKRGDLTTPESLAFMRLANAEIEQFLASTKTPQQTPDAETLVEKVGVTSVNRDRSLAAAYSETTPHGREIIRKRLISAKKSMAK